MTSKNSVKLLKNRTASSSLKGCIVLNGAMGSGKTVVSCALSEMTGMDVLHLDLLRFLQKPEIYEWIIANETDEIEVKKAKYLLDIRRKYPKLKNFEDFGYKREVAMAFNKYFGALGRHIYHKQFEVMLLENVIKNISSPCIIDLGGTMGVSLEEKYQQIIEILIKEDPELVSDNINVEYMRFERIQRLLSKFDNVIELKLSENHKELGAKSSKSQLNDMFIESGQYSATATDSIDVDGLVVSKNGEFDLDMNRLDEITGQIQEIANGKENE